MCHANLFTAYLTLDHSFRIKSHAVCSVVGTHNDNSGYQVEPSEYGMRLANASRVTLRDENEFVRAYFQASGNRTQSMTEFGSLSGRACM
jgi:hypothetical protein